MLERRKRSYGLKDSLKKCATGPTGRNLCSAPLKTPWRRWLMASPYIPSSIWHSKGRMESPWTSETTTKLICLRITWNFKLCGIFSLTSSPLPQSRSSPRSITWHAGTYAATIHGRYENKMVLSQIGHLEDSTWLSRATLGSSDLLEVAVPSLITRHAYNVAQHTKPLLPCFRFKSWILVNEIVSGLKYELSQNTTVQALVLV